MPERLYSCRRATRAWRTRWCRQSCPRTAQRTLPSKIAWLCSSGLLSRLDLRRHDAHFVQAGAFGVVNRTGDIAVIDIRIALHEDDFGRARLENILQPRLQIR